MLVNELAPVARFKVFSPFARLTLSPETLFSSVSVSFETVPAAKSLPLRLARFVTLTELTPLARLTLSLPPPPSIVRPVTLFSKPTKSSPVLPIRCSTLVRLRLYPPVWPRMTVSLAPPPRSIWWPLRPNPILTKSLADPVMVVSGFAGALKNRRPSERSTGLTDVPDAISTLVLVN